MCGFVAIITSDGQQPQTRECIERLLSRVSHRGPDGQRIWKSPNSRVLMGHARLSIIDLDSGWQPMVESESGCALSFNGEIYNYRELRSELESAGCTFRTQSDTEVILQGYLKFGIQILNKLNGMFAFVLYDPKSEKVLFARDPVGIKPLYFTEVNGTLFISSELRAIALESPRNLELDARGFIEYFSIGYSLAPNTMIAGVRQLEHGTWGEWQNNQLKINRYMDLSNYVNAMAGKNLSHDGASEILDELLVAAVKRQLISDVPVGTFLSGGVDSSLVTSIAFNLPSGPKRAFSMDFNAPGYSEFKNASSTAASIGIPLERFEIHEKDLFDSWKEYAWKSDAPIFDNSFLPSYELCRNTRKYVPVVLSGDGGDELFLGYDVYKADVLKSKLAWAGNTSHHWLEMISKGIPTKFGKVTLNYKIKAFAAAASRSAGQAHCGWREIAKFEILNKICRETVRQNLEEFHPKHRFEKAFQSVPEGDLLTRMSFVDLETWLPNDILVKMDRASMASGLETRVPLLDIEIVKFALGLPDHLKFRYSKPKRLLKEALQRRVPTYPSRLPKRGFSAPMSEWLCGPLREGLDNLGKPDMSLAHCLDPTEIRRLSDDHLSRKEDHGYILWALLAAETWFGRLKAERKEKV